MAPKLLQEGTTHTQPLCVLLLEDWPADVELCLQELKKTEFEVTADVVQTREEFIQCLSAKTYDVILADYRLANWTGMEALRLLRERDKHIPFILVTGALGEELAVECIKRGVSDYVLKDRLARLPVAIRGALKEKALGNARAWMLEAFEESEARYRHFVENATYGICRATLDGRFLDVNSALVRMLGCESREELLAMNLARDVYRDPAEGARVLEQYRQAGRIERVEAQWKRKDGTTITVQLSGCALRDTHGALQAQEVIAEDVTERRALESQNRALQKYEAIGQLAGGFAHDFNNMVGAIMGWADLGLGETPVGSPFQRHFQKIRNQAERAAALTRQLLAFARRQVLEPRNINLNQMVTEMLGLLENALGAQIEVKTVLAPDLEVARADPTQIEQVLMNLCLNARDAMPQGGCLLIKTENVTIDEEYRRRYAYARPGRYVLLSVSDTGTGMDANTLEHIFEPFFTTKQRGQGTGLGLAVSYGIVKQHGGMIHVYSELGRGTTFHIYLPLGNGVAEQAERSESKSVRGGTETILVAEDHQGLREAAREILEKLGYQVLLAGDGEEAVQRFQADRDRIALVLLDVVMPKLGGPEAYEQMRARKPGVPVIFCTGYSTEAALLNSALGKDAAVLQKPYSLTSLGCKVRELLDGVPQR